MTEMQRRFAGLNVTQQGWTTGALDALRVVWAAGLSASACGVVLGCSKSAIVGKKFRLGLAERPSPIRPPAADPGLPRQQAVDDERSPRSAPAAVVPRMPAPAVVHVAEMALPAASAAVSASPPPMSAPGGLPPHVMPLGSPYRRCRMPLWPDGASLAAVRQHPDYGRFCNAPTVGGSSWCGPCLARVAAPVRRHTA